MKRLILCTLLLVLFMPVTTTVLANEPASLQPAEIKYVMADNHIHYLDFLQKTDGFERLVQALDKTGVKEAVIFGIPMVKMWSESDPIAPTYYMDTDSSAYYYSGTDFILAHDLLEQPAEVQARFYPFISGINPLDLNAADQIEMLLKMYPGLWKGIGELMSRHDDLTAFTYGEPPRANHPALMRVYKLAAKYGLPVLIHHNISSAWKREPIYLREMELAVRDNPQTTFIWAHVGISRRVEVPTLLADVRRMLLTYPNLSFGISWVVYTDYIAKDQESLAKWATLIEQFPTRFLIGSDKVGHWDTYPAEILKYYPLLDKLLPVTAEKISRGNLLKILKVKP